MLKIKSPSFWQKKKSLRSSLLYPLSVAYSFATKIRYKNVKPYESKIPVICVGNIVMGGAGKTPVVIELSDILRKKGLNPHVVSRGYGGYLPSALVNLDSHTYMHVGDEALLIAKKHPTWIGKDRISSVKSAVNLGSNIIVMDDGLQNPTLKKNFNIMVIDSEQGFGNGLVFPSGPLRESLNHGIKRAQCVVVIGNKIPQQILDLKIPVFKAELKPVSCKVSKGKVIAFTGLGFPDKFKKFLIKIGYEVEDFLVFPDHHPYTINDMKKIIKTASKHNYPIITTEKDYVRLPSPYNKEIEKIEVKMCFDDENGFLDFLIKHI